MCRSCGLVKRTEYCHVRGSKPKLVRLHVNLACILIGEICVVYLVI